MNCSKRGIVSVLAAVAVSAVACVQQNESAKWDPNMVVKNAVVTNGVKWIDGKF